MKVKAESTNEFGNKWYKLTGNLPGDIKCSNVKFSWDNDYQQWVFKIGFFGLTVFGLEELEELVRISHRLNDKKR